MQSPFTTEDDTNRRRSWHLPQLWWSKVTSVVNVTKFKHCFNLPIDFILHFASLNFRLQYRNFLNRNI